MSEDSNKNLLGGLDTLNTTGGYLYTSNSSNPTLSIYDGGTTTISSWHNSIEFKDEYKVCNHRFKLKRSLSFEELNLITNITLNGTKYYDLMIENGLVLNGDFKEVIEPLIEIIKRNEKIGSVLKNKKDEKC